MRASSAIRWGRILVVTASTAAGCGVAHAGGAIPFRPHSISTSAGDVVALVAADLDGDGDVDVVGAQYEGDTITWYENDGAGPPGFTERVISASADGASAVDAADLDGDGDVDVLGASSVGDAVRWYENDGGTPPAFTARQISVSTDGPASVIAADVDGDDDLDVLVASLFDDTIAWYENDGGTPPAFSLHVISAAANGAFSVAAADVDGDGDLDALSASLLDDTIAWYENDGGSLPRFAPRTVTTSANGARSVTTADVDLDGDLDLLSASFNDDTLAWYENDGGTPPAFTPRMITDSAGGASAVSAADLDDDGDVDLLSAATMDDTIAWFENDGCSPPGFTRHVITTGADGVRSVIAADVDGDGRADVLGASAVDDTIAWFEHPDPSPLRLVGQWDADLAAPEPYADVWADGTVAYLARSGDDFVHIVDISDPARPVGIGYHVPGNPFFESAQDVKVAAGLLFVGVEHHDDFRRGVHIADVRAPFDPQPLVNIDLPTFAGIHNTFYDGGYLYLADGETPRVAVIDLTGFDPDDPPDGEITTAHWILDDVGTSLVHDVTVQGDRLYVSAWDSGLWIYDVSNVATELPTLLGTAPGNHTHSAWPTSNGDYVVTGEERIGGGILVFRIVEESGAVTLELTDEFALPLGQAESVHNQVIVGYRLYNAWYEAGLQIFDIDPVTGRLSFHAGYDTHAIVSDSDDPYQGAWGVYPFLGPSRILVSDRERGLLIINECKADLTPDGMVTPDDLTELLRGWAACPSSCAGDDPIPCPADLDGNGSVGFADLSELLNAWGPCP